MRKRLLIISFVALFSIGGMAQSKEVRYGLKLGPTFDWASPGSTAASNNGMRMGFNVGLVADFKLSEHLAVSSGVNLDLLRFKYTFTDSRYVDDFLEKTDISVSRRVKATNIEVPLMAKVSFDVFDSFKAYVMAGGGLSFNLKDLCKDEFAFYWVSYTGQSYEDYTHQYRLLQASMIFGLGAEYEINRKFSVFAQLTFDHSFSNAFVSSLEKQTKSIINNNFIGIEVGIMH